MQYLKKETFFLIITLFLLIVVTTSAPAQDLDSSVSGESMALDFVVLRPLGLAVTAIGCVFYVASFPFAVWSETNRKRAGHYFIVEPAVYTFIRPLGELKDAPQRY